MRSNFHKRSLNDLSLLGERVSGTISANRCLSISLSERDPSHVFVLGEELRAGGDHNNSTRPWTAKTEIGPGCLAARVASPARRLTRRLLVGLNCADRDSCAAVLIGLDARLRVFRWHGRPHRWIIIPGQAISVARGGRTTLPRG